ncbi:uncharacterized protein LOC124935350 [Impatiens glandulifera]|uniref:uncharacterized protein LOC124935350 n=1 Tax=Impatiens glandulifera TaxID=253017 RepID=UPI001FB160E2|nr:uncharacterized protein LOC124935350 [Impatiens glandulifera]
MSIYRRKLLLPIPKLELYSSSSIKTLLSISALISLSLVFYAILSGHNAVHFNPPKTPFLRLLTQTSKPKNINIIETNISHIQFGIGSSIKSWVNRQHYSNLYWKNNITKGFIWLDENPKSWPKSSPPYRVSSNTTHLKYTCKYGSRSAVRIARIVKESFEFGMKGIRWFVMGDDDTVFFVENLITILRKYDHREMYYVGGNSESVEQNMVHSYEMAYGGGGFAISYPLAKELIRVLDGCIDRYSASYGSDQKIAGCMAEIGVPVTREKGFHQVDIKGEPYGMLAAHPLTPLVSLHHLDYVKPIFPGMDRSDSIKRLMQAYQSDPNRALQQSFYYNKRKNWTFSISWGYTIQLYPFSVAPRDLIKPFQTFRTWSSQSRGPFTFETRPISADPCKRPVIYFLDGPVEGTEKNMTRSMYKKFVMKRGKVCKEKSYVEASKIQFVEVSSAILGDNVWRKMFYLISMYYCFPFDKPSIPFQSFNTGRPIWVSDLKGCFEHYQTRSFLAKMAQFQTVAFVPVKSGVVELGCSMRSFPEDQSIIQLLNLNSKLITLPREKLRRKYSDKI